MRVLYDITTLGAIHSAPGVQGAGIFRAIESMGMALERTDGTELFLSSAPTQYRNAIRYLVDTRRFELDRFAVPSLGADDFSGCALRSLQADHLSEGSLQPLVDQYLATAYTPARIYNPGQFDIYHVNWRGEAALPANSYPAVVLWVHDVIALKHPEWFVHPGETNQIGDYLTGLLESVRGRHTITVATESVKNDLITLFPHISAEQVHVTPLGVSNTFRPCTNADEIDAVRARYGIPADHRYVLCVNTLEPRKNMIAAIEAYASLISDGQLEGVCLVIAGSRGWIFDELMARCESLADVGHPSVVLTGYVRDSDMAALYSGASLFCYPSLDEGFGLPVLEAMRCGVPVITSDRAPLVEVAGDAALFVDPHDTDDLASAMQTLLSDDALADVLRAKGKDRASTYTWDRSAVAMVSVYDRASRERTAFTPLRSPHGSGVRTKTVAGGIGRGRSEPLQQTQSLAELKNMYRGKRVFILGDTLDVENAPLDLLKGEFTFAVNGFYQHYDRMSWKPTFYVVAHDDIDSSVAAEINALTGSTFFFEDEARDQLRTEPDVIHFDRGTLSRVADIDLFDGTPSPDVHGPNRAMASAIQIAYHLGFDPVYLVSPDVEWFWGRASNDAGSVFNTHEGASEVRAIRRPRATRAEMWDWHRSCRDAFHVAGRRILNTSSDMLLDTYKRVDASKIFASEILPEFDRSRNAYLDETQVVSSMFDHDDGRVKTMVDVGAHRGTSAKHFVGKGWKIYCFEPDPNNREHLVRKFGRVDDLTIDSRAVGETPAAQIPFFTSLESSGISGLSPFRESHELQGYVDVTTVGQIIDEYEISHIDFLKIDVEGSDFGVLKGVPWDRIRPDVIECEYEDAKTLPMGHTSLDIAEYLRARGYTVYLSEWHPIIRYGIPHDWRRVVPYPGIDVPSNSWGNVLAFKNDPGYTAVLASFAALVKTADQPEHQELPIRQSDSSVPSGAMTKGTLRSVPKSAARTEPASGSAAPPVKRAFYADFGDRLRKRSPRQYALLQFVRRAIARLWRRKVPFLLTLALFVGLITVGFASTSEVLRYAIWAGTAFFALALAILSIGRYAYQIAQRQSASTRSVHGVSKDLAAQSKRSDALFVGMEGRIDSLPPVPDDLSRSLSEIKRDLNRVGELPAMVSEIKRDLNRVGELQARLEGTESTLMARDIQLEAAQATMEELKADIVASTSDSAALKQSIASLESAAEAQLVFSNYSNAPGVRMQARWLSPADIEHIRAHWLRVFGLSMSVRELRYLAHKICLDEERCEGRMATTIQAAMIRALALLSLNSETIELLEIGTLCGVSAGSLHRTGVRAQRRVNLTLIDPLTGYYEDGLIDGQTGVPITKKTVIDNLASLGVEQSQYRIIEKKSTDPDALEATSDRQYDLVLIDGDHSLHGVSSDFELYGGLVRPGGILLFDDYDTTDWPAIKPYVDDHVRTLDEWLWVGGEWRTAILQKKLRRE